MASGESPESKYKTYLDDVLKLFKDKAIKPDKTVKPLFVIICVIIVLVFVHQIFTLTNFVRKYRYYFDYGNMLKGVCNGAYTEYETGRFQVIDNISDIRINLEFYHIIALIFTIAVCVFFMLLVWGYYITLVTDKTPVELVASLGTYMKELYLHNYVNKDIYDRPEGQGWGTLIYQGLLLAISLYLPLVIIVYLSLRFTGGADISPFQLNTNDSKINDNYISHSVMMGIIFIIFCIYAVIQFWKTEITNGFIILATAFVLLTLFAVSAYITTLVCDIYVRKSTSVFYKQIEKFERDPTYDKDDDDIMNKYIKECLGFKQPGIEDQKHKWHKIYNDVITIVLLIWCTLLGIFIISFCFAYFVKKSDPTTYFSTRSGVVPKSENKLPSYIYYFGVIPFAVLYIMLVLVTINVDYNININKYILFKPYTIYRQILEKINDIFNKMLENDKTNVSNNSVCKNYANAIHLAIYQDIFKHTGSIPTGVPNGDNINHPSNNDKTYDKVKNLLFLPKFTYNSVCDSSEYVEYNKLEEYNIDAYINEKYNMFFDNSSQCDSIKNILLVVIMNNFVPDANQNANDMFKKETKKTMFKYAIAQIKSARRFDGKQSLELSDNYETNNRLNNEFVPTTTNLDGTDKHLNQVIDQVANIYDKYLNTMLFETRRTLKTICECADTDDITSTAGIKGEIPTTIMNNNSPYITNIKKNYVNVFVNNTKEMFESINNVLTSTIEINENNRHLAYFVMKNYNMIYTDDKAFRIEEFPNKTKVSDREDPMGDAYLHIEFAKIDNKQNYDIKDLQTTLRTKLIAFQKEYNALYHKDNNYYNQLVYDYKVEYITKLITASDLTAMKTVKSGYESKYFKLSEFAKKIDNKGGIETKNTDVSRSKSDKITAMACNTSQSVYAMILLYILLVIFSFMVIR
jgi:hypothetical protein